MYRMGLHSDSQFVDGSGHYLWGPDGTVQNHLCRVVVLPLLAKDWSASPYLVSHLFIPMYSVLTVHVSLSARSASQSHEFIQTSGILVRRNNDGDVGTNADH